MFIRVNFSTFCDEFHNMGRGNQFSYDALEVLFDYYEQLEEDIGEPIEFDVIAICCEWTEYESEEYLLNDTGAGSIREVEDDTVVIPVGEGYLMLNY